jgi:ubiquinone/menaquinone biosynthesis C-methylase UbiE
MDSSRQRVIDASYYFIRCVYLRLQKYIGVKSMTDGYKYFKGEKDKDFHIDGMKKYVAQKQELDKLLFSLLNPILEKEQNFKLLDVCCGIGHLIYFLSEMFPQGKFHGVDQTPFLIEEAKQLCAERDGASFEVKDAYDLGKEFEKAYDVSINWKTVSWLPYYEDMIKALVHSTKKHIFLSSMFYNGDIDFITQVREFQSEKGEDEFNHYYNVYSLPRFEKFVKSLGAKHVEAVDFDIGIDLEKPDVNRMGTYTEELTSGKKLQISGAVLMSWKIIRIDL